MLLESTHPLIQDDLTRVNDTIRAHLNTDLALIRTVTDYIIQRKQRIRPVLVLVVARMLGEPNSRHHALAGAVELIHGALALHAEVGGKALAVDETPEMALLGDEVKILLGDLLYTGAFKQLVSLQDLPVTRIIAKATNVISQGEVMHLVASRESMLEEARYLEIIQAKTACLFEAAARGAAMLSATSPQIAQAMAELGLNLGIAYQLQSEIRAHRALARLLASDTEAMTARIRISLPIIHTLANCAPADIQRVRESLARGETRDLAEIIVSSDPMHAIAATARQANEALERAQAGLAILDDSEIKRALMDPRLRDSTDH